MSATGGVSAALAAGQAEDRQRRSVAGAGAGAEMWCRAAGVSIGERTRTGRGVG